MGEDASLRVSGAALGTHGHGERRLRIARRIATGYRRGAGIQDVICEAVKAVAAEMMELEVAELIGAGHRERGLEPRFDSHRAVPSDPLLHQP